MNEADSAVLDDDTTGFDEGFNADPTETPGHVQQADDAANGDDNQTANDGQPAQAQAAPEYVQLTKQEVEELRARAALVEELKATQDKSFGTAFGKLGDLERRLKAMGESAAIEVDQDEIDALRADGFEPLAKALEKVRNLKALPGSGVDSAQVEALVQQRVAPALQRMELRLLAKDHPDWQQIDKDPAFGQWVTSQGAEFAQSLAKASSEYDGQTVSDAMTKFKAHRKAVEDAAKKASQQASARQSRFAAAVTPRGSGGTPASDPNAEFDAGFREG